MQGNPGAAIAVFGGGIRLDPEVAPASNNRGNAYGVRGNPGRAIADLAEAIRLEPKYAVAYNNRGSAYLSQGRIAPPSPTLTRRSGSIPSSSSPTAIGVTPTASGATTTAPSPT